MNVGQGKAYNVNVTMEVPGLHLEKTMFAGEVEKGTSAEIDGAVLVDGKQDKEKYGNTEGNFIISYTDEKRISGYSWSYHRNTATCNCYRYRHGR